jgi:hypothetical protein
MSFLNDLYKGLFDQVGNGRRNDEALDQAIHNLLLEARKK